MLISTPKKASYKITLLVILHAAKTTHLNTMYLALKDVFLDNSVFLKEWYLFKNFH